MPPTFIVAEPVRDRARLLDLNVEYMTWNGAQIEAWYGLAFADVAGMSVEAYVARVIHKVCGEPPPRGIFYLVECDGRLAGMGGLRLVRENVCELKRLYVRPDFRGRQLGQALVKRLQSDAQAFGFRQMLLDSGPFMQSAHRVYEAAGFSDCPAYPEAEVPVALHAGWRFMSCPLQTADSSSSAPAR